MATAYITLIKKSVKEGDIIPFDAIKELKIKNVLTKSEARDAVKSKIPEGWKILKVEISYGSRDPYQLNENPIKMRQCTYCGYKWPMRKSICSACGADLKKTGEVIVNRIRKNVIAEKPKTDCAELFTRKLIEVMNVPIKKHSTVDHTEMYKFGNPFNLSFEEREILWKMGRVV